MSGDEGKKIEISKLDSMKNSRAYHGACMIEYNNHKYLIAVGGQQTQKSLQMAFGKDSDTMTVSSSGYEVEVPRNCITE